MLLRLKSILNKYFTGHLESGKYVINSPFHLYRWGCNIVIEKNNTMKAEIIRYGTKNVLEVRYRENEKKDNMD